MDALDNTNFMEPRIPPHILLMEDETVMAKGLKMVLDEEGYDVELAMTGQSALYKSSLMPFDLLVADLRLPDMDGINVIREVKHRNPDIQAIIITGYSTASSVLESAKLGVFEYLRKPFTEDQFREAVESALKKKFEAGVDEYISHTEQGRQLQKDELVRVLDKLFRDNDFLHQLMERGSDALKDYKLSSTAKAAIISGDLKWLKDNVDGADEKQIEFICKHLEREEW